MYMIGAFFSIAITGYDMMYVCTTCTCIVKCVRASERGKMYREGEHENMYVRVCVYMYMYVREREREREGERGGR